MVACKTTQNAGGEHSRCRRYAGCWSMLGTYATYGKESLLRFATALSALAVTQVGVGLGDREQLNTLQQQIQVSALYPTMGA